MYGLATHPKRLVLKSATSGSDPYPAHYSSSSSDLLGVSYIISCDVDGNEAGDAQTEMVSVCIGDGGCSVKSGFKILDFTGALPGKTLWRKSAIF